MPSPVKNQNRKTVYISDEQLAQLTRSGLTIGEIVRRGLNVSAPLEVPPELRKAMAVLNQILEAMANGAKLTWPEGYLEELAASLPKAAKPGRKPKEDVPRTDLL